MHLAVGVLANQRIAPIMHPGIAGTNIAKGCVLYHGAWTLELTGACHH